MRGNRKSYGKKTPLLGANAGLMYKWDVSKEESTYMLAALPAHIVTRLAVHGLGQKLGDLSSKDEVSSEATMRVAVEELWTALVAGEWEVTRKPRATMTPAEKKAWYLAQIAKLESEEANAPDIEM